MRLFLIFFWCQFLFLPVLQAIAPQVIVPCLGCEMNSHRFCLEQGHACAHGKNKQQNTCHAAKPEPPSCHTPKPKTQTPSTTLGHQCPIAEAAILRSVQQYLTEPHYILTTDFKILKTKPRAAQNKCELLSQPPDRPPATIHPEIPDDF